MSTHTDPLVEMVPIAELKLDPKNPRTISTHEFESLQRSIDQFGFVEPVVANKRNMVIIGGHQRVRAAEVLGVTKVPVVWVDLDEKHQHALNIALNKISGEFDKDVLAELILTLDDELLSLTGFDESELEALQASPDFDEPEDEKPDKKGERKFTLEELLTLAKSLYPAQPVIQEFLEKVSSAS